LFPSWFAPFLSTFHHQAQRCWAPLYVQGLCSTAHRKSIVPLAERVAPGQADPIQHFITDSPWTTPPLLRVLARQANTLLGGKRAVLIIDDTCLTKFGKHSVGVARQYSGQVGKIANCQCLVSLTLAKDELPIPLALRLFLPSEWTEDPARMQRAGVPPAHAVSKPSGPWHSKNWTESEKMLSSASCSQMRDMATTLSSEKRFPDEACSGRSAL